MLMVISMLMKYPEAAFWSNDNVFMSQQKLRDTNSWAPK